MDKKNWQQWYDEWTRERIAKFKEWKIEHRVISKKENTEKGKNG